MIEPRVVFTFREGIHANIPIIMSTVAFMLKELNIEVLPSGFTAVPDPSGRLASMNLLRVTPRVVHYVEVATPPVIQETVPC